MTEGTDGEFTAFVNERGDALLRVAYALAGSQHAAEDLLQNALAKAYTRGPGSGVTPSRTYAGSSTTTRSRAGGGWPGDVRCRWPCCRSGQASGTAVTTASYGCCCATRCGRCRPGNGRC